MSLPSAVTSSQFFLLRQGHVQAIVISGPRLQRDVYGTIEKRIEWVQNRRRAQHVRDLPATVTNRDQFLSFSLREPTCDLAREVGRRDQLVNGFPVVIAQSQGIGA